jgi:hypothetical protein
MTEPHRRLIDMRMYVWAVRGGGLGVLAPRWAHADMEAF